MSSKNATTWGFLTRETVLSGESEEEFANFRQGIVDSFEPTTETEAALATQIADAAWRLRRVIPIEVGIFNENYAEDQAKFGFKLHLEASYPDKIIAARDTDPKAYRAGIRLEQEAKAAMNAPENALGRAFIFEDSRGFIRLSRYESHLDRRMNRDLQNLMKLQAARKTKRPVARAEQAFLRNEPKEDLTIPISIS